MEDVIMLGVMVVVAVTMILYSILGGKKDAADIVRRRSAGLSKESDPKSIQEKARKRASQSVFEKAAPLLSRPVMPKNAEEQSTLRAKLSQAGFRKDSTPTLFLASKTVFAVIGGALAAMYGLNTEVEMAMLAGYIAFGLGAGFMAPNLWLNMSIGKRAESIRNGLPDSLDLMVVGVEAGLGLDAALLRVSDEMASVYPALAEEFQIATVETQMGVTRGEALSKMAERTAVEEMRALVATITQAEKLGTSVAKALRIQAESLRVKRRQKAEERAQKTAVKLLIPLVLFIFPTIFIVLAGPAALHLMDTFNSGAISK
ncbi:MAG TPA: type II secretion system F family protein [Phycisphaerae bacterium]|nr:type II secretion system F family protein [Phycisphaerae bacterium]HRW52169.1 type II secretion system F family protein [Phycisphaerae bacterium]